MPGDPNSNSNSLSSLPLPAKQGDTTPGYVGGPGSGSDQFMTGQDTSLQGAAFNPYYGGNNQAGGKMTGPQGQVYGNIYGQANNMSGYFNQQAAGYNQNAPQIGDQSQFGALNDYYTKYLNGDDAGYAENQFRQSQDQSIAAQMAMANSARGGAASQAGAMRSATQGAGAQMASAANQAAQIRAQEQQQAAAGLMGVGNAELQRGSANAQLQQANQAQINQMQQSLYSMGEQEQGLGLSAQQAYMQNLLAAEGINTQQSQFNTQLGVQATGAGLQAGSALISASDSRAKTDIQPQGAGISSIDYHDPHQDSSVAAPSSIDYSRALNSQPQKLSPDQQNNAAQVGTGAGMGAASGALSGATAGPVGAAMGAASGALSGGLGSAAQSHPDDQGLKAANVAGQAGAGALTGATLGSALGPWGTALGGIGGGVAGAVKGLVSDETKKVITQPSLADDFLDHMKPYSYKYKDPNDEPRERPTGGTYLGVMAQDLEHVPHVGPQLILNTPHGKMVDQKTMLSALAAGTARLNERVRALESDTTKEEE